MSALPPDVPPNVRPNALPVRSRAERGPLWFGIVATAGAAVLIAWPGEQRIGADALVLAGLGLVGLAWSSIKNLSIGKDGLAVERVVDAVTQRADQDATVLDDRLREIVARIEALESGRDPSAPSEAAGTPGGVRGTAEDLPPILFPDDPQKGRFGGLAAIDGRVLRAAVEPVALDPVHQLVTLTVTGTTAPLAGPVRFHLHDTFRPDVFTVAPVAGTSTLRVKAWGAFTVGAVCLDTGTRLELDLAGPEVVGPADWKQR